MSKGYVPLLDTPKTDLCGRSGGPALPVLHVAAGAATHRKHGAGHALAYAGAFHLGPRMADIPGGIHELGPTSSKKRRTKRKVSSSKWTYLSMEVPAIGNQVVGASHSSNPTQWLAPVVIEGPIRQVKGQVSWCKVKDQKSIRTFPICLKDPSLSEDSRNTHEQKHVVSEKKWMNKQNKKPNLKEHPSPCPILPRHHRRSVRRLQVQSQHPLGSARACRASI